MPEQRAQQSFVQMTYAEKKRHEREIAHAAAIEREEVRKKAMSSFNDESFVTVLHGYGTLPPMSIHYIDDVEFIGGIARDVEFPRVKHWLNGTREGVTVDGKPVTMKASSRVHVHVMENDASEADFAKEMNIVAMDPAQAAAAIRAMKTPDVVKLLGPHKAALLMDELKAYLETEKEKADKQVAKDEEKAPPRLPRK